VIQFYLDKNILKHILILDIYVSRKSYVTCFKMGSPRFVSYVQTYAIEARQAPKDMDDCPCTLENGFSILPCTRDTIGADEAYHILSPFQNIRYFRFVK
jgi:hypothetical protein